MKRALTCESDANQGVLDLDGLFIHLPFVEAFIEFLSPLDFFALYATSSIFYRQAQRLKASPKRVFEKTLTRCLTLCFDLYTVASLLALLRNPRAYLTGGALCSVLHADYDHFETCEISDIDIVMCWDSKTVDKREEYVTYTYPTLPQFEDIFLLGQGSVNYKCPAGDTLMTADYRRLFAKVPCDGDGEEKEGYDPYSPEVFGIVDYTPKEFAPNISLILSKFQTPREHVERYDFAFCKNSYNGLIGIHIVDSASLRHKHAIVAATTYLGSMVKSLRTSMLVRDILPTLKARLNKYVYRDYTFEINHYQASTTYDAILYQPEKWFCFLSDEKGYQLRWVPYFCCKKVREEHKYRDDPLCMFFLNEFAVVWSAFWEKWVLKHSRIKQLKKQRV